MTATRDDNGHGNGNGRVKVSTQTLWNVLTLIVAVLLAYGTANARIAVLEDRYERLIQDVREIKIDVKELLTRR